MMEAARVSVVIPLYNKRPWVTRALRAAFAQRPAPSEVLVVDDGSTDGGVPDPRAFPGATIVSRPHLGAAAARNHGVAIAREPWIALLDADDEWEPGFLEQTLVAAARHPAAVAVFSNIADDHDRPLLATHGGGSRVVQDYFALLLQNRGHGMSSSSTIVRRDLLLRLGGFPERARRDDDLDTWARLAWSGPVVFVSEVLARYHTFAPGRLMSSAWEATDIPPTFLDTYVTWRDGGRIPRPLAASSRDFAAWCCLQYVAALAHDGHRQLAHRLLLHGIRARVLPTTTLATLGWRLLLPARVLRALRRLKTRLTR